MRTIAHWRIIEEGGFLGAETDKQLLDLQEKFIMLSASLVIKYDDDMGISHDFSTLFSILEVCMSGFVRESRIHT